MRACYQTENQSVAEHGLSVAKHYCDLIMHIDGGKPIVGEWKLPDWCFSNIIKQRLIPFPITTQYLIYHDCGKPYCRTVDESGRVHFPNHASVSKRIFDVVSNKHTFSDDDAMVSRLISEDMDIHLLKATGVGEFSHRLTGPTLLMAGLAEIHSNAKMFGGIESISFKSKWKNLNRRGNALVKLWKGHNNANN